MSIVGFDFEGNVAGGREFRKKNTSTRKPGPSLNNEAIESTRLLKMMCLILKFVWEPQGNS